MCLSMVRVKVQLLSIVRTQAWLLRYWDACVSLLQVRYQKGIQVMLDQWINKKPFEEDNYIVREGKLAGQYS